MARLSLGDKTERVLRLLLALRNTRIVAALAQRGFHQADLDDGWKLLRGCSRVRLDHIKPLPADPKVVVRLDEWENQWFPIADATLARRFPAVRDKLFLNLSQTEGPAVVVSVGTFVERYEKLDQPDGGYGPDGPAARKQLEARGINAAVIGEAKSLLATAGSVEIGPEDGMSVEEQEAHYAAAEEALWAWYLEWSRIARATITSRVLLRQLGFLRAGRDGAGEVETDEPADTTTEAPAASPA